VSPQERARLERLHDRVYRDPIVPRCQFDGFPWPCSTREVLDALTEAEQERDDALEMLRRCEEGPYA
jgi:hypothetical protein